VPDGGDGSGGAGGGGGGGDERATGGDRCKLIKRMRDSKFGSPDEGSVWPTEGLTAISADENLLACSCPADGGAIASSPPLNTNAGVVRGARLLILSIIP